MSVASFLETFPGTGEHAAFSRSPLWPVAPEYATGEVLLGGAYRKLLLGVRDSEIDLEHIEGLAEALELTPVDVWRDLFLRTDALASPAPRGRRQGGRLRQLIPLVPALARHALVLGRRRNRWEPGNLLLAAVAAGVTPDRWSTTVGLIRDELSVGPGDDVFARFVEGNLDAESAVRGDGELDLPDAPWRAAESQLTPAERFVTDLLALAALKSRLTRRQWTLLVEACMRIGLGLHALWLLGLNWQVWRLVQQAVTDGTVATASQINVAWEHHHIEPILTVGADASSVVKRSVQRFVLARIGLNVTLHALNDAGVPWDLPLASGVQADSPPQASIGRFLEHVAANRANLQRSLTDAGAGVLPSVVAEAADRRLPLLEARSGFSKNISEFLRYALGQLQPDEQELAAHDQAYVLRRRTAAVNSTLITDPGPAALLFFVYGCSHSMATRAPSVDVFRGYMRSYGIHVPAGEFTDGSMIQNMERLGLVIDSPDAGGGRLLVRPF